MTSGDGCEKDASKKRGASQQLLAISQSVRAIPKQRVTRRVFCDNFIVASKTSTSKQDTALLRPELSVIVPFYNEEENIVRVHGAIAEALNPLNISFEMIFVDDGSQDRTLELATQLAMNDHRLRVVKFKKNYGQTAAMAAGIAVGEGRVLITMDGDLQNDPRDIAEFLQKINAGFDIVVGWRRDRQDRLWTRKLPSMVANRLIAAVTGVPIRDNGCSLKAFRAEVIKSIPLYNEMHRFIPAMASVAGPMIAEIPVRHHARRYGTSKYGLSRIYKVVLDLLTIKTVTSFMARPMRGFFIMATPTAIGGVGLLAYSLYELALHGALPLPLAGAGAVFLMCTIVMLGSGIAAELVIKVGDLREFRFSRLTAKEWREGFPG